MDYRLDSINSLLAYTLDLPQASPYGYALNGEILSELSALFRVISIKPINFKPQDIE